MRNHHAQPRFVRSHAALALPVLITGVPLSGTAITRQAEDVPVDLAAPVIVDSVVFVADFDGSLHAIAGEDR